MTEKKKDPRRQQQGRVSRARGKSFEDRLDDAFAFYRERGEAEIDKTPEPMKVLRSIGKGQFIACFLKKAQPDYKGTVKGGISIVLEAKHTDKDRMTQDYVTDGQMDYMRRHTAMGAKCYVVAGFSNGKAYRVPYEVWNHMQRVYGRKYVTPADLEKYEIVERSGILLVLHRTKGEHSHD